MTQIKTNAHTQGPWTVNGRYVSTSDATVAHVSGEGRSITPEQAIANGRLIAAAPELLAALQAVSAYWAGGDVPADINTVMQAAINRATGAA